MSATIFKALSDENRLRILNLLFNKELCVCEIEVILDLNQSNVSRNLRILRKSGFVETYKDAQWVHYNISDAFKRNHESLVKYLENVFKDYEIYRHDNERLKRYEESQFNCQIIGENRVTVLEVLN